MTHGPFKKALRDAAVFERPEFSNELHGRVMVGVRRQRAAERLAGTSSVRWWAGSAVAAGVAVAVGVWAVRVREQSVAARQAVVAIGPAVSSLEEAVRETAGPVREQLHDARFAYLDRDAKRLAKFLWRSVPGVPGKGQQREDRQ